MNIYFFLPPPPKPYCTTPGVFASLMCRCYISMFKSLCLHTQNMRQLFYCISAGLSVIRAGT